jgi:hypothetical protein
MTYAIKLHTVYMGDFMGPDKVNDTCGKTMHTGTMDRGFTVFIINNGVIFFFNSV